MIFRFVVLIIVTSLWTFENGRAASGVIWSKERENFVQLYSIPRFDVFHDEIRERSRETEKYRFNGEVVNLIVQQPKFGIKLNDKSPSIQIWRVIEEQLNITLTIRFQRYLAKTHEELLEIMEGNNTQIITPVFYTISIMEVLHFNTPFFTPKNFLSVQPQWEYEFAWIFELFSMSSWCYFITFYIVLSLMDLVFLKVSFKGHRDDAHPNFNLSDYFLYTFGAICYQGYLPDDYRNKFKILHVAKQIFVVLIYTYYSSLLIYYLSTIKRIAPFEDVESLLINTNYTVLVSTRGSISHIKSQRPTLQTKMQISEEALTRRLLYTEDLAWIIEQVCLPDSEYAWIGISRQLAVVPEIPCDIMRVKQIPFNLHVTSIMAKDSPYKRTIDVTIMKVKEAGLMSYWLQHTFPDNKLWQHSSSFMSITIGQVNVIFLILWAGMIASLIILAIERIAFSYDLKKQDGGR